MNVGFAFQSGSVERQLSSPIPKFSFVLPHPEFQEISFLNRL